MHFIGNGCCGDKVRELVDAVEHENARRPSRKEKKKKPSPLPIDPELLNIYRD